MYTFVIRSADRKFGSTNDFRVQLPFLGDLAKHDYWKVSVQRAVLPKATGANGASIWYQNNTYSVPTGNTVNTTEFIELHLNFGSACKGHDTQTRGGRFVHIIAIDHMITDPQPVVQSRPQDAIEYEIARPGLNELHVQLRNKLGAPLGVMMPADFFPYNAATSLTGSESPLPEWMFILRVEPIEKNI